MTESWSQELQDLSRECFPDALRGLYFGPIWAKACLDVSSAITKTNLVLLRHTVCNHSSIEEMTYEEAVTDEVNKPRESEKAELGSLLSVKSLARRWAEELDDMV